MLTTDVSNIPLDSIPNTANKEGMGGSALWNGQLACLEFLLHHSITLRLQHYDSREEGRGSMLQTAANLAAAADSLLSSFRALNPQLISSHPRLVSLVTLGAAIGSALYYNHPECPANSGRCCARHRVDGWRDCLALLKHHFSLHPRLAERYKTITVLLASVVSVEEQGPIGGMKLFRELLDGVFNDLDEHQLRKVQRTIREIEREIENGAYDVDLYKFEETLFVFLEKQIANLGIDCYSPLVDRFSDLVLPVLSANGSSAAAGDDNQEDSAGVRSGAPDAPSLGDLNAAALPVEIVDIDSTCRSLKVGNIIINDSDGIGLRANHPRPGDCLKHIPPHAFRQILANDELLNSIVHRTNEHVQRFIKSREAKRPKLTDRHDSAVKIEWSEPSPSRQYDTQEPSSATMYVASPPPPTPAVSAIPVRTATPVATLDASSATPGKRDARKPWSLAEIERLQAGYKKFGTNWRAIQQAFGFSGRTNVDLKDKYRNLNRRGLL